MAVQPQPERVADAMLVNTTKWMVSNYFLVISEKVSFKSCLFSISHVKEKQSLEFFLYSKILINFTKQQLPA